MNFIFLHFSSVLYRLTNNNVGENDVSGVKELSEDSILNESE